MRGIRFPRKLFLAWFQGWDRAPGIVTHCRHSWEHHNPTWEIHLLDEDNLSDYIDLDGLSHLSDILPPNGFSDIVRIHLLKRHGGVWSDATCFCCLPLDDWLYDYLNSGFFAFDRPTEDRMISSWFLAAAPDNPLVDAYCQAVSNYWSRNPKLRPTASDDLLVDAYRRASDNYWGRNPDLRPAEPDDKLADILKIPYIRSLLRKRPRLWHSFLFVKVLKLFPYFWFHYIFEHCYRNNRSFRETWDATVKIGADIPHRLQDVGLLQPISDQIKQEIDNRIAPLYKLTWKLDDENIPKGSTLDYLKNTLPQKQASQKRKSKKHYVMRSETNRMIYFINPKCACTTIKAFMATTDRTLDVDPAKIGQDNVFGKVDRVEDVSPYLDYFKFTFVRNPWDRLVSCYLEKILQQRRWREIFGSSPSFADFVRIVHGIPDEKADMHYRSQYLNLTDSFDKLVVDFVGRVETLHDDMKAVASVRSLDYSLGHFRKSNGRRTYREYYEKKTRDLAGERYAKDIKLFGYEF